LKLQYFITLVFLDRICFKIIREMPILFKDKQKIDGPGRKNFYPAYSPFCLIAALFFFHPGRDKGKQSP